MGIAKNKRILLKADLNAVPRELLYLLIFFNFGFNKGKEGVWISDAGMGPKNILRIRKLFQTQSISITMTALRHPHLLSVQITPKCVSNGLSGEILDTTTQKEDILAVIFVPWLLHQQAWFVKEIANFPSSIVRILTWTSVMPMETTLMKKIMTFQMLNSNKIVAKSWYFHRLKIQIQNVWSIF